MMSDLVVRVWMRQGQHRLYLLDSQTKETVGHYDRLTGKLIMLDESRQAEATKTLRPFMVSAAPQDAQYQVDDPPAEVDLSGNIADAALQKKAAAAELAPTSRFQRIAVRLLRLRTGATAWEIGAVGERIVGEHLARLKRDGWYVLQSVALRSGADIDHVVIGPAGVFTINTKHHARARIWVGAYTVKVNGREKHYLRNSRHEAQSASRRLGDALRTSVRVTPVLAFVNAAEIKVASPAPNVLVVQGERIDRQLKALPHVLSKQSQDRIYAVARRSEIWTA
jgi:hypothetical protein